MVLPLALATVGTVGASAATTILALGCAPEAAGREEDGGSNNEDDDEGLHILTFR